MKIGLGTVQFGMDYGISNVQGKPNIGEVRRILNQALKSGMVVLDTASLYGNSEEVIGKCLPKSHTFRIVTKTPQFKKKIITPEDAKSLTTVFYSSLEKLNQSSVYGILIHNVNDLLVENGHLLMESLLDIKRQGLVKKIGVSIYESQQIDKVLDKYKIDLIQVPINILDQRLIKSGHLKMLKQYGVEIHARSVFLQGLLLMRPGEMNSYFNPIKNQMQIYHQYLKENGISPIQGALGFISLQEEIDCTLVGVCSYKELLEIQEALRNLEDVKLDCKDFNCKDFSCSDERIINPSMWSL